jgi:DNA-binding NarL/FixJ family response regulator
MLALSLAAAIVAESAHVRSGLSAIFSNSPTIRVVAEATPSEARALPGVGVDVVVCDVPDGESAQTAFQGAPAGVPILALTGTPGKARELMRAGARGVISRDASLERLSAASIAVAQGLCTLDEQTLAELVSAKPPDVLAVALTRREHEVLELVAEGLSNKVIALRLDISEHTAKFHVNSILEKLEADTRTDAVVRAARSGVLKL